MRSGFVFMNKEGKFLKLTQPASLHPDPPYLGFWGELDEAEIFVGKRDVLKRLKFKEEHPLLRVVAELPAQEQRSVILMGENYASNPPTVR